MLFRLWYANIAIYDSEITVFSDPKTKKSPAAHFEEAYFSKCLYNISLQNRFDMFGPESILAENVKSIEDRLRTRPILAETCQIHIW